MAKAKTDLATRANTLPANWEAQMAADAKKAVAQEANVGVGSFMSIRGGILQFQQTPVPGNKFQGVILASILENAYYTKEFDPQNPSSPDCYSFSDPALPAEEQEKAMVPHAQSPEPQSKSCAECQWNKFGSAEKGRGKACKNGRRMSLIHVDDLKKDSKDWTVAFLKIPPMSLPGWATYVRSLEDLQGRPAYGVVSEVAVVPDLKSQYKVTFGLVSKISDKKSLGGCFMKHNELEKSIGFPYQVIEAPSNGGKAAKKKPAAKPAPKSVQRPAPAGGSPFGAKGGARGATKF